MKIVTREISPKPPTFKAGATVAFVIFDGTERSATFVRRESRGKAGIYYIVNYNGGEVPIFANGHVGLTVTPQ